MESTAGAGPLGLDDLRNEQTRLLSKVTGVDSRGGKIAAREPGWDQLSVHTLHARTRALEAELDFHQDLLKQLQTPEKVLGTKQT